MSSRCTEVAAAARVGGGVPALAKSVAGGDVTVVAERVSGVVLVSS
jgi:hypothetical protein